MGELERVSGPQFVESEATEPVRFGATFVKSEAFKELFREGMGLVEETAGYLDGDGRNQSNGLSRSGALAYASESMRLTTRLMQIASWLLVQRAVAEGEITPVQAQREKDRVRLVVQDHATDTQFAALPERTRDLVALSLRLHARIMHLDRLISGAPEPDRTSPSPVAQQHRLLRSMFEIG